MAHQRILEKTASVKDFRGLIEAEKSPFLPGTITHIYVQLEFKPQFENAKTADDARKFHRSINRAAHAAHHLAESYGGWLLEVQGSMLHVGLQDGGTSTESFVAELHHAYNAIFDDRTLAVDGWRLTVDIGRTLIVAGRGVHNDESYVSLGRAANNPAKHLYRQMELAEDKRALKRFFVGLYNAQSEEWVHRDMNALAVKLNERNQTIEKAAKTFEPSIDYINAMSESNWKMVTAQAVPIDSPGTTTSPQADKPLTNFGWVMRADLDGFTKRVEECFDDDAKLMVLAQDFYAIMEAAAEFVDSHRENMIQLPWAGDNFTSAAVFTSKVDYDEAIPRRLVELSMDFEKELNDAASGSGFGGWAHSVAGGLVHGNSNGNVYVAGIEIGGRRFLVGAGEGFGRTAQAFTDIKPKANCIVAYMPDYKRLDEDYKERFVACDNTRGEKSTLYMLSDLDDLVFARGKRAVEPKAVAFTPSCGKERKVLVKPHYTWI